MPVADALSGSAPLQSLLARLAASRQRWAVAEPLLPLNLRSQVQPGPLDDTGWTLLAANPAVAAKLRHLVPLIDEAMRRGGWNPTPIRVKPQGR